MNQLRRVINNTIISLVGQAVTWTSTFLLTIAYGRFLGDSKFGELYFTITFLTLLSIPLEIGNNNQIIRGVAQEPHKAQPFFSSTIIIKICTWPIVYAVALLLVWLLGYPTEVRVLVGIYGLVVLSEAFTNTFASFHYAFQQTIFPSVGLILEKGLTALFGILLLRRGAGVEVMALVMLGAALVSMVWQAVWFFRRVGVKFVIDQKLMRTIVRANVPFIFYGLLLMGYTNIDTVLLSFMTNSAVVGWYGAASRLFDTLNFLPTIVVGTILYPIFAKLSTNEDDRLKLALEKSVNFLFFCSIPIATLLMVATPSIVGFIYQRAEFRPTIPVLQILAPGLIFIYVNYAFINIIMSKKQDKKLPILASIALAFNLGLNLVMIPLYQHIGAAIVTVCTEVLYCSVAVFFLPRHLLPLRSLRVAGKSLIASLLMGLAIWPVHALNILIILPIALFTYLAASLLIGVIPREDYLAVYSAIRQKVHVNTVATDAISQEQRLEVLSTQPQPVDR